MSKRLVMIDGNSLLFRAYFAMREMVTRDGVYTHGVFAFINMLNKILADYEPDYIGVAFDMKAKTFRHEKYPAYKAGRLATPVELLSQIPLTQEVLRAMNIAVLQKETYEADDIIGTVTRKATEAGVESVIITGDKDELQLIDENTRVVINKRGVTDFDIYDVEKMRERYDLTPLQFIDLKGLMGDKSDNIPGIPGVGEKQVIALLKQYGSVESVVEHADEIKGKLGENVRANTEIALLSKELATIFREVPIEFDPEELLYRAPDLPKLTKLYKKLEFNSFLRKLELPEEEEPVRAEISAEPAVISAEDFLRSVPEGSAVVAEMQTDNNHVGMPVVSCVMLYAPEQALYAEKTLTAFDTEIFLRSLAGRRYRLTGMELKVLLYSACCYDVTELEAEHDIVIAEYLIDPNRSRYHLTSMMLKYLRIAASEEPAGFRRLQAIGAIASEQTGVLREKALLKLFREVEMPLIRVLASMEKEGITVRRDRLEETGLELDEAIRSYEQKIYEAAGTTFNINSPKQLGAILFEEMHLPYPKGKKGKTGYSTAADVLDKLRDDHPIVADVLEYRKAVKLKSTYIDGLTALIGADGRIHPHFMQTVAATGRLSCTEPNLQNIPIRDEYGRNIRKAFTVSEEGRTFIGADYSQIELRILAALSGDEVLIDAFNRGEDIHRVTASRVFEIPMDEVTALDRSRAKAVNFGVIYGMSGFGLSEELGITRQDAQRYIDEYFEKHTAVKAYLDAQIKAGKADHEVRTLYGRIRQIPEFASRRYMDLQLANRLAMNTPIQGTAADIIKIAMVHVDREIRERGLRSRLILQIHDELIVEAVSEEAETVKELLIRNMENAADLTVRLLCDVHSGTTWFELK
ncbi:MAG: DNA polymerase I [Mogibacterium sp.]|nr:DNA polymerase I [Mogibacterium sp.]